MTRRGDSRGDEGDRESAGEREIRELVGELVRDRSFGTGHDRDFLAARFDSGLAWVDFPAGLGGRDLPRAHQRVVREELDRVGAANPFDVNPIGHGSAARALRAHGTLEQQRRLLRPLFLNDEIWCQLFSESGAGSDLASLRSRAVRDGDTWRISGQKVWTTFGHGAHWGLLVARTGTDKARHRGLTVFVLDMEMPGITVRPLRQMTGDVEFNEVFLDDVRVPDEMRLGGVDEGWAVVLTVLESERLLLGSGEISTYDRRIASDLLDLYSRVAGRLSTVAKDQVVRVWTACRVVEWTARRLATERTDIGTQRGGLLTKVMAAEQAMRVYDLSMNLIGAEALLYGSYEMTSSMTAHGATTVQERFLRSRALSIEGGTSQILRNVIGERLLGLPREPRTLTGVSTNGKTTQSTDTSTSDVG